MRSVPALLLLIVSLAVAQQAPTSQANVSQGSVSQAGAGAPALVEPNSVPVTSPTVRPMSPSANASEAYTVVAGTHIAVTIKHSISTRTARENDPVFAETSFPVVSKGHIVIPVGTFVQGVIQRSRRPGRVKGRGELVIHFNTLIFPSGYTLMLPGSIDNVPGAEKTKMGQEGSIEGSGNTGKDAGTVAKTAGTGAAIGAVVAGDVKGAATGGIIGAGAGLASVLLSRGPEVRIESGTLVDMVLQRDIVVERDRIGPTETQNVRVVR